MPRGSLSLYTIGEVLEAARAAKQCAEATFYLLGLNLRIKLRFSGLRQVPERRAADAN